MRSSVFKIINAKVLCQTSAVLLTDDDNLLPHIGNATEEFGPCLDGSTAPRQQRGLAVGGRQFVNKLADARAEEVARFLDIPGGQEIVQESYAQLRKFNCWNISIVQQYARFKQSRIRSAVFGNSRQFFIMGP